MFSHAHTVEVAWFLTALLSTGFNIRSLRDAIADSTYLTAADVNGPRKIIADSNRQSEQFRLTMNAVMLIASVSSLFFMPPPPQLADRPGTMIGLMAWIAVALLMCFSSIIERKSRRELAKYADAKNPIDPTTGHAADPMKPGSDAPVTVSDTQKSEP